MSKSTKQQPEDVEVTRKVSQFFSKTDKLVKLFDVKNVQTMKFKRFVQGSAILVKYNIKYDMYNENSSNADEDHEQHILRFISSLVVVIENSITRINNKEYVANVEMFQDLELFFTYV